MTRRRILICFVAFGCVFGAMVWALRYAEPSSDLPALKGPNQ